jgi:hypothetical protein
VIASYRKSSNGFYLRYSLPADELPVSSVVFVPAAVAPGVADESWRVGALIPRATTLTAGPVFERPAHTPSKAWFARDVVPGQYRPEARDTLYFS